jgi:hypothetical protein
MFSIEPPEFEMGICGDTVLQQEPHRVEGEKKKAASAAPISAVEKPDY